MKLTSRCCRYSFPAGKMRRKIMSKTEDSYIFCAALIRASERSFFPNQELTRAAEAADCRAMSVLTETGTEASRRRNHETLRRCWQKERRNYDFVFSAIPRPGRAGNVQISRIITTSKQFLRPRIWELTPKNTLTKGGSFSP